MLKEGQHAPSWKAQDDQGVSYASEGMKGRWFLLYFYPKDDTPGCTIQACGIRDAWTELSSIVSVLGVSSDSQESHSAFRKKYSLPFPLLVDAGGVLRALFGSDGSCFPKRTSFLIDSDGVVKKILQDFDCHHHSRLVIDAYRSFQPKTRA